MNTPIDSKVVERPAEAEGKRWYIHSINGVPLPSPIVVEPDEELRLTWEPIAGVTDEKRSVIERIDTK